MPEVRCRTENDTFDREVWSNCLHKEIKEFEAIKPSGVIQPKPVRPIASLCLTGLASSHNEKQTYSLFCTPAKYDRSIQDECETLVSAQEKLKRLSKMIKLKDRQIKFHHTQRIQASVTEEELRAKLAASLNELKMVNEVLQNVTQQSQCIQNENNELRQCVNQLQLENLTLQDQFACHLKEAEILKGEGQGFQDGGGEGLSENSKMSNVSLDETTFRTDSLCFYDEGKGPFVSPVKFDMHTPLLWDDALSRGDKSSNASTTLLITDGVRKSPRSFLVRLRTMMRKLGGKRYHLQE